MKTAHNPIARGDASRTTTGRHIIAGWDSSITIGCIVVLVVLGAFALVLDKYLLKPRA